MKVTKAAADEKQGYAEKELKLWAIDNGTAITWQAGWNTSFDDMLVLLKAGLKVYSQGKDISLNEALTRIKDA